MAAGYDLGTARGRIIIDTTDLNRAEQAFTSVGKGLLGIGALAAAGFGIAVKSAADFEKTLSAVGAVLGVPRKGLEDLRDLALDLGRKTKFSAQEIAAGMEDMAKAGLNITQITGGATQGVIALASAAGDMKLDEAALIAVNAMKTFDLPAKDLTHVADVLAGAANASTVEVEDLAVSMRYAGATAKTAGLDIDDMNTVLAILGDRGIRGSTAGTSLRGVLLSLSGSSGPARKALKELGIITEDGSNKFFDSAGNMKHMSEVMQILGDATKGLSQEQKIAAFNTIFQRRAMASAIILAESGAAGFDKYAKAISRVSAAEVASQKLDNLAGDMTILKTSIQTMLIEAGTPFQAQLREWTQGLIKLVNGFGALAPETQRTIFKMLAYTAVAFTAMGVTSLLIGQVIKFIGAMRQLGAAIVWVSNKTGLVLLFEKLKFAMFALRYQIVANLIPALQAMGASLFWALGPAALIVAAFVALAAGLFLLYKKWKPFHDLVDKTWQSFQVGWDVVKNFIGKALKPLGNAVVTVVRTIKRNWDLLLPIFLGPFGLIIVLFRRFGDQIGNVVLGIIEWFRLLPGRIVGFLVTLPGIIVGFFSGLGGGIVSALAASLRAIGDFLYQLPAAILGALAFLIGRFIQWEVQFTLFWVTLGINALKAIGEFLTKLPGLFLAAANEVWDLLWEWGLDVQGFFSDLPGRVIGFVNALWDWIFEAFTSGVDDAWDQVWQWGLDLISFFEALPGNVAGFADAIWDWVYAAFVNGVSSVWGNLGQWRDNLFAFFRALPANIGNLLSTLAGWIGTTFRNAGIAAWNGLMEWFQKILNFMATLPQKMLDAMGNVLGSVGGFFSNIGSSIWQGFKNGLFGSPKTKIQYALEDLLTYMQGFNVDAGREMAKLADVTYAKMGEASIQTLATVGAGAGIGVGTPTTTTTTNHVTNEGDTVDITGASEKSSMDIARDVAYIKRIRRNS